jgi:DNA-binding NarL/FixJ family response regulator
MREGEKIIRIALVDDHQLLRSALASLIDGFDDCTVICQANNGTDFINQLQEQYLPHIVLLDLNMPQLDGYETTAWLKEHYPEVHVLMLTMYDAETTMIRLLQAGAKGFLKKDIHPSELKFAIQSVMQYGYYYSHTTTGKLVNLFRGNGDAYIQKNMLNSEEIEFLKYAATDLTYKEIARKMGLNPRSVDNLRDHLFEKLDVKSRVGLAIYALRHGIIRM